MARSFRTFRRKRFRRSPYDLQTSLFCRNVFQMVSPATCGLPNAYATMLAGPFTTLYNQNLASPGAANFAKAWTWGGCHFQTEWSFNPANASSELGNTADFIEIYEAICVLPLAQGGFTSPAYVPTWTNVAGGAEVGDASTRILWKRVNILPFWGVGLFSFSQLESTMRDVGHGPIVIKTKARLTEREGIFHVFNIVSGTASGSLPIVLDGWFRQAIKLSR